MIEFYIEYWTEDPTLPVSRIYIGNYPSDAIGDIQEEMEATFGTIDSGGDEDTEEWCFLDLNSEQQLKEAEVTIVAALNSVFT